jgi:hypothetical protein
MMIRHIKSSLSSSVMQVVHVALSALHPLLGGAMPLPAMIADGADLVEAGLVIELAPPLSPGATTPSPPLMRALATDRATGACMHLSDGLCVPNHTRHG